MRLPNSLLRPSLLCLLAAAPVLSMGCASGLKITKVDASHRKPSNVAVFFSVDTRKGEPVAGLDAENFEIYEDGKLVSVDESQQTVVNQEVAAVHHTLLLVDMSGSVSESDQVPLIADAAAQFAATLEGQQKVGLYAFDGSEKIHRISPFVTGARAGRKVNSLTSFKTKDPSTNLNGAIVEAVTELEASLEKAKEPLKFGTLVIFTDGTDRASRLTTQQALDKLDGAQVDVFAIGVGNEIDEPTLSRIGRSGYVLVEHAGAITQAFEAISERVLAFTQRYYLLSYCSPARAGSHEVTIRAVRGGEKSGEGELSYTFEAEGFGPKCDPAQPPPFDTSGRRNATTRVRAVPKGTRIQIDTEPSTSGSEELEADGNAEVDPADAAEAGGHDFEGEPAPEYDGSLDQEKPPALQ